MALDAGNIKVFCRGVDLSTALQSVSLEQTREEADGTAYADTIRKMQGTLQKVALAHAGLYGDGLFSYAEVLRQSAAADDEPITVCPDSLTLGNKGFIALAHRAAITVPEATQPGQLHRASLRASSRSPIGDGVVAYNGAVSANSQTAGYNIGAPVAGQTVLAAVHLIGITPAPTATFFLESAPTSGFASPTVRDTSALQSARGSLLLTEPGAITDAWWRVRWTFGGTGNFTAVIAIGLAI